MTLAGTLREMESIYMQLKVRVVCSSEILIQSTFIDSPKTHDKWALVVRFIALKPEGSCVFLILVVKAIFSFSSSRNEISKWGSSPTSFLERSAHNNEEIKMLFGATGNSFEIAANFAVKYRPFWDYLFWQVHVSINFNIMAADP